MYPEAYIHFLVLFHGPRDYFECHDELEEHWKKDPRGERKAYWMGLIQLAVMLYHYRRGNIVGAKKMIPKALSHLEPFQDALLELGINPELLLKEIHNTAARLEAGEAFQDINIPLEDTVLKEKCVKLAQQQGWTWESPSDLQDCFLVNKHKLRRSH